MKNPTLVFPEPRKVELIDREIPALQNDKVLIETEVTAISIGTELTVFSGDADPASTWGKAGFPYHPGYSNVGKVIDAGPAVERSLIGKRVQSYGNHGRFVAVPLEMVREVRPELRSEHAVFATLAEIALHGVRRSEIGLGSSVVVYGLGLLGQLAARFARLAGARPVLGVDLAPARLRLLPNDPAVIGVNPGQENVLERVRKATRERLADVAIEFTGAANLIPDQLKVLRKQGTLAIVSGPRGKTSLDFHDLCVVPSLRILGVHNGSHPARATGLDPWTKARDVEYFLDVLADGEIEMDPLISHRLPFAEGPAMYHRLLEDRSSTMGIVLNWQG